jgi:hypothetical protein
MIAVARAMPVDFRAAAPDGMEDIFRTWDFIVSRALITSIPGEWEGGGERQELKVES